MPHLTPETLGYAFLGGIMPALVWLYFLLREDARCPEPKTLIAIAFVSGMAAVPLVLPLEQYAIVTLSPGLPVIVAWAAAEETMKYVLAATLILWRRDVNESVDLVVYMLTVALGFAAMENALFLLAPLSSGNVIATIATDNLRFIGSTLVHVLSSSAIGFALAFSFRKRRTTRTLAAAAGLILAISLHALFNFLIIEKNGSHTMIAFFLVWTGAIVFFAVFELLKFLRYHRLPKNTC